MKLRKNKYIKIPEGKIPNAMIVNTRNKKRMFRYVPEQFIPNDSFEQYFDKMWLHFLTLEFSKNNEKIKGVFEPIDKENVIDKSVSPTDVYVAKNCADEVREVYGISMSTVQKIKWGIFIGLCVACLILIFFLVFGAGGAR